jgi:RimJ/RimL family protein N-acetyltransferase
MGYAREAVERLIELAREEMGLDTLYAEFMRENESSRRLLSDMGFSEIPEREYELFVKGEFKNISVYVKSLSACNIQN